MAASSQRSSRSETALAQAARAATPIAREFTASEIAKFGSEQLRLEGLLTPDFSVTTDYWPHRGIAVFTKCDDNKE
jgi:hypothetical protein